MTSIRLSVKKISQTEFGGGTGIWQSTNLYFPLPFTVLKKTL